MASSISRLQQEGLSAAAMGYLNNLPDEQKSRLADQLVASMEAKDQQVDAALSRALEVVPAPFRRAVRKLLFS